MFCLCGDTNRHQSASNEPLMMKIGRYLLVDVGTEGEKKKEKKEITRKWYISPYCPNDPLHPIDTKSGMFPHMGEVIKIAKFGVDWFIGVCSARS